jgi:NAD(P)-dependent dehydrogenase (short-subunit alcohol dehydrogenase family)
MTRFLEEQTIMKFSVNIAVLIALGISGLLAPVDAYSADDQKAVLVTGATSGIGRNTAERLAKAGYFVYAGARKAEDIEELSRIDNIMAVRIDVTKQDQIDAAVALIEKQGRGLWGVVNNAGVSVQGPLIEVPESDLQFILDVNVMGVYRITKAFAPMIIQAKGRIVNISSISGVLTAYGYGPYSISKHAVEAYTDTLADEMWDFGVRVSAIEPGNYKSKIGLTRCKRMLSDTDAEPYRFHEAYRQWRIQGCLEYLEFLENGGEVDGEEPDAVAAAVEHALFAENPKEHYMVVPEPMQSYVTLQKLTEELLTMNHGQEYSMSREELIELIDAVWPYGTGEKHYYDEWRQILPMFYGWKNTEENMQED